MSRMRKKNRMGDMKMERYCLVCESMQIFDNAHDDDCNRCRNCMSLPYSEVNDIVLGHRKEWKELNHNE